jgi:rfaE bifunctional protein nucleotidyltransferase chain/domain
MRPHLPSDPRGPGKLTPLDRLTRIRRDARRLGKIVVFTNGCFDLLHAGHVHYLNAARRQGDVLIVGLNSDASVRGIKGALRPVVPEGQRAEVLAGLAAVDHIVLFDEPDPLALILALAPDVLVKGGDWAEADIVGADAVKRQGGRVVRVAVRKGVSTSAIIARILERGRGPEGALG